MTSPAVGLPVDSASSKSDSPEYGHYILCPYTLGAPGNPKHSLILDQLCARPYWTQAPMSPDDLRRNYALLLSKGLTDVATQPEYGIFEVWRGGTLVGILTLHGIIPGIEAVLHFVFFDGNLIGKRTLLKQFIRTCFRDYGFRRLLMQVPEPVETLIRIARKLGFRCEGETALAGHPALERLGMDHPERWVARQGSRKQAAHWYGGQWVDLIQLRLLASEVED